MINRSIKSAIITGPTGAIGTALCELLAKEGVEVFAICRPSSNRISSIPIRDNIHIIECDVNDLSSLTNLIHSNIDAFYHFAWANTIGTGRNDMASQIKNIQNTIDAVRAAKGLGCSVFIGAGSQAEYGRVEGILSPETPCFPENGYGMAKLCAGEMSRVECEKYGIDHIWTRVLSVYGPNDGDKTMITSVIKQLLEGRTPKLTEGIQKWDFLYSSDAARAMYLLALHGKDKSIYPVGSGKARPLKEYIEILRDSINPKLELGFGEIEYSPLQVMFLQANIDKLREDTGFEPLVEFDVGIIKTIKSIGVE